MDKKKYGYEMIYKNKLERWTNNNFDNDYSVHFTIPEFTCVCPRSGFPDFATFYVSYRPDKYVVELKSLKLYINGYRDVPISHEDVTNKIFNDLWDLLEPKELKIVGDFARRGNIHTKVKVRRIK